MNAIRSIVQTDNTTTGWNIWLQWVLASCFGYGAGAAIGNAIATTIPPMTCTQGFSNTLVERLTNLPCILPGLDLALLVIILGLVGGFMQWLVLRHYIARAGWWVSVSALSLPIALAIADGVGRRLDIATPLLMGVLFGILSGILPWIVLRRQVPRAGWWVPAHLLGSLLGGAMSIAAFHIVGLIGFYPLDWTAAGAMFGAGFGSITGIALVWLLRPSFSEA